MTGGLKLLLEPFAWAGGAGGFGPMLWFASVWEEIEKSKLQYLIAFKKNYFTIHVGIDLVFGSLLAVLFRCELA